MTARAHASHMGVQYTTNTARDIMYWPRMHTELVEAVQRCAICQESQPALPKEPLMTHPVPKKPWQLVASDCFEVNGQNYCVLVDLYSEYIDLRALEDVTSESLIKELKPVFATHGIPHTLITDNGSNYVSTLCANDWDFEHTTSSPYYSKSNGKAESAVKIAKGLVTKAAKDKSDVWKAILEWRNTTTPGMSSSPAQRLMSRRTRSFLPCKSSLYKPRHRVEAVTEQVVTKRQTAKLYHDRTAKSLPDLVVGQLVRAKTRPKVEGSPWTPGVIKAKVAPRSYIVEVGSNCYRRNRVHLRDSRENAKQPTTPVTCVSEPQLMQQPASTEPPNSSAAIPVAKAQDVPSTPTDKPPGLNTNATITRSGRISRPPKSFSSHKSDFGTLTHKALGP
ncbi:uncharacterized protein K02A2.6-like [Patiria miniata]|uniref:Integrase catalytic domain-containing protein n=1 Tax=Patiria miniata TaxID=46514 RepID=A0A913ZWE9_PATMI|nr:uncharacterized protein K02A2.6-like [Patiria miniata]XP_038055842.1 uncharacterized protein K02A2.6-like [Patiria miniata]